MADLSLVLQQEVQDISGAPIAVLRRRAPPCQGSAMPGRCPDMLASVKDLLRRKCARMRHVRVLT